VSEVIASRGALQTLLLGALVAVGIGLYLPLATSPPLLTEGMEMEVIASATPGAALAYQAGPDRTQPLANLVRYGLLKLTGSPASVRVGAAILHGLGVALLFSLVRRLLQRREEDADASLVAPAAGAVLFAVHPLATEAVAAHGAFPIVLGSAFALGALLLAARAGREEPLRPYASAGLFLAALLCEASLWPLAFVAAALARGEPAGEGGAGRRRSLAAALMPYAASVALFYVAWIARAWPGIELLPRPRVWSLAGGAASHSAAFLTELRLLLFPAGLSLDHLETVYNGSWNLAAIGGAVLLSAALIAGFCKGLEGRLSRLFLAFFALPHLHYLLFPPADPLRERRLYICLAGAALAAAAAARLIERRVGARAACACAILAAVPLFLVTVERARLWHEPLGLWESAARGNTTSARSHVAIANLHLSERRVDDSLRAFEVAASRAPRNAAIQNSIAELYFEKREYMKALQAADKAMEINPSYVPAYLTAGNSYMAQGRAREAFLAFNAALLLDGDNPSALFNMGALLFQQKRYDQAVGVLEQAAALRPGDPDIQFRLGMSRLNMRDLRGAAEALDACLDAEPGRIDASITLAGILTQLERHEEARRLLEGVLEVEPANAQAIKNLGVLASARDDWAQAASYFARAMAADPDDLWILLNLAGALEQVGETDAAIRAYRQFLARWTGSLGVSEDARARLERLETESGG
jgi:tetratricopeptide (TPR) repeat protein